MLRPVIPAALVLLLCISSAAAAQRRITGRVTEEGGAPLSSVSITVPGTTVGAVTGDNGAFTLVVPAGDVQLNARRIGYRRRTIAVGAAQSDVQIALERDPYRLEAQIVTGAATTVARQNVANDVGLVTADQLARVPSASIENALAGKIAGAQVIANGGAPGGGNQIRMRGVTSVFGSADPLYVVDGVIISNDVIQPGTNALTSARRASSNASNQDNGVNRIADLNPNDIETVEVLKGASASAIYGSKASNGVILIKTKTGSAGAPVSNVTQRLGTFQLARKFNLRRFATVADAQAYAVSQSYAMTPAEVAANYASCNGFCDFEQELYGETPLSYETGLGVRGGTGTTNYFVSGLTKYDGGIQKNTGYKKDAIRLNLSQLIGDKLSLQVNNNYIRTLTRRGISNNDNANITPYFVFAATPSWFDMRPRDGVYPVTPVMGTNSFQNVDFIQTPDEVNRIISSVSASYQLLNSERQTLALKVDGGIDRFNEQVNIVSPRFLIFEPNDGLPGTVTSNSGAVMNLNLNASLAHTYTPAGRRFSATTAAGIQRETSSLRSTNVVTRDVLLGLENVNSGSAPEVFANREEVKGFAVFAQEELLALNEKLLLTAGVRAERSTRNGDVNKLYAFPKASVSYRLVDAIPALGEVKLRLAAGQSGNQPLYLQKYRAAITGVYDRQNGVQSGPALGDPNIKPERQTEIETGFDAQFANGRGSLAFTLYQKTIDDVILQIATAPSVGYTVQILNGGQFRNRGAEALLEINPVRGPDYGWTSRTTFAKNVGIVTALPVPAFTLSQDATGQGVAFGAGYGIARLEVGQSVTQIVGSDGPNPPVKKGDASPNFTMGFSNELTWKGVRLSTLFDWQKGGNLVNVTKNVFDAFALAPDVADGGLARINLNDTQGFAQYIEDASFVKLREVALGYDLPRSWFSRLGGRTRSVRLEVSGRNLYTWTKYTGADPEVSNFGNQQISRFIDLAPFPPSRSFFFTVDVGF
ncbi:MAG: SusC/RagA family TonB-linked outer membrane protein [Gemmatimonadaceae bacterium]|nr:SusC/RagA family TonB-linked outer membrane protein [Gemmatimonadaceae bacterium]NUS48653.1 SusC/RagA family TonB-linked outer membrane protein [Gemmatimonadaceae bacterium]